MRWHGDTSHDYKGLDTGRDTLVRQEFAADADINTFLRRYGAPVPGSFKSGEVDYDTHLLDARLMIRDAREAFQRLPGAIRQAYPSWDRLFDAVSRGEVVLADGVPVFKPADTPPPVAE